MYNTRYIIQHCRLKIRTINAVSISFYIAFLTYIVYHYHLMIVWQEAVPGLKSSSYIIAACLTYYTPKSVDA